ncbi:gamma-glutamyltransferase [Criibacterium bergeronii]|uniref:Glutathione hydrolase proenzyme n=1 Tax=Criibacterium bergeronii TaxID=1871336 RepID=A0A1C0ADU1_9FIRM|nr:gamma-glutamyltransferase [Criibacterium bergeronii]MBS6062702.1 gamma-glutamyltransferase [Peptostreptococcaceae bacterium]RDY21472.1 gamma-glutamyltransferase [Criibacterium bergeronii]
MKRITKRLLSLASSATLALSMIFSVADSSFAAAYRPQKDTTTGLVMSTNFLANEVGKKVLDNGGNAFDAAVAVGYMLAVVHPSAGNIGGGGFAVIHTADGKNTTLDFREVAPLKAQRDMYLDKDKNPIDGLSVTGYKSAGVPGTVAGLNELLAKYGTKSLDELIQPAIDAANNGFAISERQAETFVEEYDRLKIHPSTVKYFFKADGKSTYKDGEILVQKDLAKTLERIKKDGTKGFYEGETADLIAKDMAKNGGLITKEDLKAYKPIWRDPIKGTYRGYDIISMGPPSSGGAHVIQILNVLENADVAKMGFGSSEKIHLMAEAERYAYADRSEYMGDPSFVKIPLAKITSKEYAKSIYDAIQKAGNVATPSEKIKPGQLMNEPMHTTHYSIADFKGNAIAVTYTINYTFGSGATVDGAGFLLNDEMDDFSIKPGVPNVYGLVGGDANAVEAGKRPLSSMTPTIILKDGKVYMVVGSPGGARIITTVSQVISNVIDHNYNISEAVEASRFHMQWLPDELRVEKTTLVKDVQDKLEKMGYKIAVKDDMGDVNAIIVDNTNHTMYGSKDPRTEF